MLTAETINETIAYLERKPKTVLARQYLRQLAVNQELSALGNTVYSARPHTLNIRAVNEGGNGRIRAWLFIGTVVALYLFFAVQSWGWINV